MSDRSASKEDEAELTQQTSDYSTRQNNPRQWLGVAKGLMLSARVIWDELYALLGPDALANDRFDRLLAYWQSYLLLTAYAFENVYRAILTARGRSWREVLTSRGGHGLAEHIAGITPLNEDETNLVKRLETYLIWAGRYVVPKQPKQYEDALREFRIALMGSDLTTAEKLFIRLEEVVEKGITDCKGE